jgi:very-short-patch-repair endonuclease
VRDAWFGREGYQVLRVSNRDVLREPNVVLETIAAKAKAAT